jgi:hypothetical protein
MSIARSDGRRIAKIEPAETRFAFGRARERFGARRAREGAALVVRRFGRAAGARFEPLPRVAEA